MFLFLGRWSTRLFPYPICWEQLHPWTPIWTNRRQLGQTVRRQTGQGPRDSRSDLVVSALCFLFAPEIPRFGAQEAGSLESQQRKPQREPDPPQRKAGKGQPAGTQLSHGHRSANQTPQKQPVAPLLKAVASEGVKEGRIGNRDSHPRRLVTRPWLRSAGTTRRARIPTPPALARSAPLECLRKPGGQPGLLLPPAVMRSCPRFPCQVL